MIVPVFLEFVDFIELEYEVQFLFLQAFFFLN